MNIGKFLAGDKAKTFKPKKSHRVEAAKLYDLHARDAQATPDAAPAHCATRQTLPEGEDEHEWLAVNTVDFFNEINLLYGIVAEFCTEQALRAVLCAAGRSTSTCGPTACRSGSRSRCRRRGTSTT